MVQCEACFSHQGEFITPFALFDNLHLLQDAQNANDFIFVMLNIIAMHFCGKRIHLIFVIKEIANVVDFEDNDLL